MIIRHKACRGNPEKTKNSVTYSPGSDNGFGCSIIMLTAIMLYALVKFFI